MITSIRLLSRRRLISHIYHRERHSMGDHVRELASVEQTKIPKALRQYNLYGWIRNKNRTNDENYMDIVMLITRSSHTRGGSMGCIIVKDYKSQNDDEFYRSVIAASTNKSLYRPNDSDIHAEISAIGQCAQNGIMTEGSTIYITMPPCKKCFGAIVSAGITRVVSSKKCTDDVKEAAKSNHIELVNMFEYTELQRMRLNQLIQSHKERENREQYQMHDLDHLHKKCKLK